MKRSTTAKFQPSPSHASNKSLNLYRVVLSSSHGVITSPTQQQMIVITIKAWQTSPRIKMNGSQLNGRMGEPGQTWILLRIKMNGSQLNGRMGEPGQTWILLRCALPAQKVHTHTSDFMDRSWSSKKCLLRNGGTQTRPVPRACSITTFLSC